MRWIIKVSNQLYNYEMIRKYLKIIKRIVNSEMHSCCLVNLSIWVNFNPNMDKQSHAQENIVWHYLSISNVSKLNQVLNEIFISALRGTMY